MRVLPITQRFGAPYPAPLAFGCDYKLRNWQKVIPAMWGLDPGLEAGCDSFKSASAIKRGEVASNPTSTHKIVA